MKGRDICQLLTNRVWDPGDQVLILVLSVWSLWSYLPHLTSIGLCFCFSKIRELGKIISNVLYISWVLFKLESQLCWKNTLYLDSEHITLQLAKYVSLDQLLNCISLHLLNFAMDLILGRIQGNNICKSKYQGTRSRFNVSMWAEFSADSVTNLRKLSSLELSCYNNQSFPNPLESRSILQQVISKKTSKRQKI